MSASGEGSCPLRPPNNDIITDPPGFLAPGARVRVPFYVTEADIECTPLVMTDENVIDLLLEAPDGSLINAAAAPGLGMTFGAGAQTRHYRFTLPVAIGGGQREGLWHAVLEIDRGDYKKALERLRDRRDGRFQSFATHGARYSVAVQTYSNLKMKAAVEQGGFSPGAELLFQAALSEYGLPVEKRASVQVELTRPGGSVVSLAMAETLPGTFEVATTATLAGVYHARFLARGATLRGTLFTREHLATAAVWHGGDQPYQPPSRDTGHAQWCRFLECLLSTKNISRELSERLEKEGISLDGIRRCIQGFCHTGGQTRGPQ